MDFEIDFKTIFITLFVILFIVMVIVIFFFNKKAVVKRKLKKALGKPISEFADGDVAKVVGKVEIVGQPLIAPLSKRECAYYHVLVEKKVYSDQSSSWETLIRVCP